MRVFYFLDFVMYIDRYNLLFEDYMLKIVLNYSFFCLCDVWEIF